MPSVVCVPPGANCTIEITMPVGILEGRTQVPLNLVYATSATAVEQEDLAHVINTLGPAAERAIVTLEVIFIKKIILSMLSSIMCLCLQLSFVRLSGLQL